MVDIFGAGIAQAINNGLGPLVFDQILYKVASVRDSLNPTKIDIVRTPHGCKGFVAGNQVRDEAGTLVRMENNSIIILGASLPTGIVPAPGDEIEAEGRTFVIVEKGVSRDPAGATYECECN
jgi:hypothetical protein